MQNVLILSSIGALASGCIVYDDFGNAPRPRPGPGPGTDCCTNAPPEFVAIGAEIFIADRPSGDRLFVSAEVFDPDGLFDIYDVYVEIYDDYDPFYADTPLSAFSLVPSAGGQFWDESIPLVDAGIDPFYADVYSVDFIVEDSQGIGEIVNVLPDLAEPF